MIANVLDLEPIVVSDLFGVAPQTAHKWAQYAQSSWAAYLAARTGREAAQVTLLGPGRPYRWLLILEGLPSPTQRRGIADNPQGGSPGM